MVDIVTAEQAAILDVPISQEEAMACFVIIAECGFGKENSARIAEVLAANLSNSAHETLPAEVKEPKRRKPSSRKLEGNDQPVRSRPRTLFSAYANKYLFDRKDLPLVQQLSGETNRSKFGTQLWDALTPCTQELFVQKVRPFLDACYNEQLLKSEEDKAHGTPSTNKRSRGTIDSYIKYVDTHPELNPIRLLGLDENDDDLHATVAPLRSSPIAADNNDEGSGGTLDAADAMEDDVGQHTSTSDSVEAGTTDDGDEELANGQEEVTDEEEDEEEDQGSLPRDAETGLESESDGIEEEQIEEEQIEEEDISDNEDSSSSASLGSGWNKLHNAAQEQEVVAGSGGKSDGYPVSDDSSSEKSGAEKSSSEDEDSDSTEASPPAVVNTKLLKAITPVTVASKGQPKAAGGSRPVSKQQGRW